MTQNSIIFLLINHDTMVLSNSCISTTVKDAYQFSQSIAKQQKKIITVASHNGNMINPIAMTRVHYHM